MIQLGDTGKTYLNWSSGKDAALSLFYLQKAQKFVPQKLLTSVNTEHNRISMHGLRVELLEKQVDAIGIPLVKVELPEEPDMKIYEQRMTAAVNRLKTEGFKHAAFGDIFLEDLRYYREDQLGPMEINCIFPLWKRDTGELIRDFIQNCFKAVVVAIDESVLDPSFLGREIDKNFVNELPAHVDPCGENGEFHTFCYDGPVFKQPVYFTIGEKVRKTYKSPKVGEGDMGFWFCDLLPAY